MIFNPRRAIKEVGLGRKMRYGVLFVAYERIKYY